MAQKEASAAEAEPPGAAPDAGAAMTSEQAFACLGYIESLRYCLEQRGEQLSQTLLMGISGETFRLCYDRNDPERGLHVVFHNPVRAACAALGYACEVVHHPDLAGAMEALAGYLAGGGCAILHTADDWVVVRADAADPTRVLARRADGRIQSWPVAHLEQAWLKEPGLLELGLDGYYWLGLGAKERDPDQREAAMASLRRGVRMLMRRSRIDGCAAGLAAYAELLDSLLGKQRSEAQRVRSLSRYALWVAGPLTYMRDSRRAAAEYLAMIQPQFDEETQEHLRKAADGFRTAAEALGEVPPLEAPAGRSEEDEVGPAERRALRAFAHLRRRVARRVRRALRAEEQALVEIRRALESAEKKDKE